MCTLEKETNWSTVVAQAMRSKVAVEVNVQSNLRQLHYMRRHISQLCTVEFSSFHMISFFMNGLSIEHYFCNNEPPSVNGYFD